jgi:hypothetical protein
MRGHSVLQVPVPALEEYVAARTRHYDEGFLSTDPDFTHAHVTVLGPFVPHLDATTQRRIAGLAASVEPFAFGLQRVATFPNGIVHLAPEPDGPLRELTAGFAAAFPDFPPYAGEFEPVPHLTLDALGPGVSEESTRRMVAPYLPVTVRAERLDLAWYEPGNCHLIASWPVGGMA